MNIRAATSLDREVVRDIHLAAFDAAERDIVAELAVNLLTEESTPTTISLLAESEGAVAGHAAFSPVTIADDQACHSYILAPLGVKPEYQKRGVGFRLVESGLQQLTEMGVNIVFVYGDPEYYGRFGFSAQTAEGFEPPYKLQYPFGWQATNLSKSNAGKSSGKIACVAPLNNPTLW
jgi:putative acetyltransferase